MNILASLCFVNAVFSTPSTATTTTVTSEVVAPTTSEATAPSTSEAVAPSSSATSTVVDSSTSTTPSPTPGEQAHASSPGIDSSCVCVFSRLCQTGVVYCQEDIVTSEASGANLTWPQTEVGQVAEVRCVCQASPDLLRTSATRLCMSGGVWESPNDAPCTLSPEILPICSVSCLHIYFAHAVCLRW